MSVGIDVNAYLGGVASGIAIVAALIGAWRWRASRLAPRVTVERDVLEFPGFSGQLLAS